MAAQLFLCVHGSDNRRYPFFVFFWARIPFCSYFFSFPLVFMLFYCRLLHGAGVFYSFFLVLGLVQAYGL